MRPQARVQVDMRQVLSKYLQASSPDPLDQLFRQSTQRAYSAVPSPDLYLFGSADRASDSQRGPTVRLTDPPDGLILGDIAGDVPNLRKVPG